MRLAYVINCYPKGSHSFIRREIVALEALGHSVTRLAVRVEAALADQADREEADKTTILSRTGAARLSFWILRGICYHPVRVLRALPQAFRLGGRGLRPLIYWLEAIAFAGYFGRTRPEHIHAHFGTNSTAVACLLSTILLRPYSFTVHGPEEFDCPASLRLAYKMARARFVVAISHYGRSQLMRLLPSEFWHKIHLVRCGLGVESLKREPTAIPGRQHWVMVGRLCPQKAVLVLLQAFRMQGRSSAQLTIVGDGPDRPAVAAYIARHKMEARVHCTGWQDGAGVQRALQNADALILPSVAEGLPVVIMEAFAAARPVISTFIAGIPELVQDGENGWLVPAGDVVGLAAAMEALANCPLERLTAMGLAGRRRVLAQHDAAREAAKLAALFKGEERP